MICEIDAENVVFCCVVNLNVRVTVDLFINISVNNLENKSDFQRYDLEMGSNQVVRMFLVFFWIVHLYIFNNI